MEAKFLWHKNAVNSLCSDVIYGSKIQTQLEVLPERMRSFTFVRAETVGSGLTRSTKPQALSEHRTRNPEHRVGRCLSYLAFLPTNTE